MGKQGEGGWGVQDREETGGKEGIVTCYGSGSQRKW